jgi:hypothetical protein
VRNHSFSEILDTLCEEAGVGTGRDDRSGFARRFRGAASKLHRLADQLREGMTATPGPAGAFDFYQEHLTDRVAARTAPRSCDPKAIATELRISKAMSRADLVRLRREFARENHPDRVDALEQETATRRMMIANMLIDRALKIRETRG